MLTLEPMRLILAFGVLEETTPPRTAPLMIQQLLNQMMPESNATGASPGFALHDNAHVKAQPTAVSPSVKAIETVALRLGKLSLASRHRGRLSPFHVANVEAASAPGSTPPRRQPPPQLAIVHGCPMLEISCTGCAYE